MLPPPKSLLETGDYCCTLEAPEEAYMPILLDAREE